MTTTTLWNSDDLDAWRHAHAKYGAVVAGQDVSGLVELNAWYQTALPVTISERHPAFVEPRELREVVRWKMKRGEWRARNLVLVESNDDERVRDATREGFASVPHERRPLALIGELAGVGPATASAVLAAYRPDLFPFLDDLVGSAIPELGEPKFTLPYYLRYAAALRARAATLGSPWTAQDVGLALWSAAGGKAGVSAG